MKHFFQEILQGVDILLDKGVGQGEVQEIYLARAYINPTTHCKLSSRLHSNRFKTIAIAKACIEGFYYGILSPI